jgi:hypothetical protein
LRTNLFHLLPLEIDLSVRPLNKVSPPCVSTDNPLSNISIEVEKMRQLRYW